MDDRELMREILAALIDDTTRQSGLIEAAIRDRDAHRCGRLAHYSKSACINCGANAAAAALQKIEQGAASADLAACHESLASLLRELARLRRASYEELTAPPRNAC